MQDRIEKQIEIDAPVSRVWKALTDHTAFSAWFGVELDGPFVAGRNSTGMIEKSCSGGSMAWNVAVKSIVPERYFAFEWHPHAIDPAADYSQEKPTLVEFTLTPQDGGTLLKVTESGFGEIPEHRRAEAFRMNTRGWGAQMENIKNYVGG